MKIPAHRMTMLPAHKQRTVKMTVMYHVVVMIKGQMFQMVCLERRCDIILLPCFEIVVCSQCWQDICAKHINECNEIYKNNKRKLATEKKKVLCPCCGKVVVETKEFRMATF